MKKIKMTIKLLFLGVAVLLFMSQDSVQSAFQYLDDISNGYKEIQTMEADVSIKIGTDQMEGRLSYKAPGKLRIDFSLPSNQVFVVDGRTLTIYIPRYNYVLVQDLTWGTASNMGLSIMTEYYDVSYLNGPNLEALDDSSSERVKKLKLVSKSQAVYQMIVSVGTDNYIRRIIAYNSNGQVITMDFKNIRKNISIPDSRFDYDPPGTANEYKNFLIE